MITCMHISRVAYLYQGEKINAHRLIQIKVGRGPETNFFLGWPYLHICYMYITILKSADCTIKYTTNVASQGSYLLSKARSLSFVVQSD